MNPNKLDTRISKLEDKPEFQPPPKPQKLWFTADGPVPVSEDVIYLEIEFVKAGGEE